MALYPVLLPMSQAVRWAPTLESLGSGLKSLDQACLKQPRARLCHDRQLGMKALGCVLGRVQLVA